jgi:hypothetical protein
LHFFASFHTHHLNLLNLHTQLSEKNLYMLHLGAVTLLAVQALQNEKRLKDFLFALMRLMPSASVFALHLLLAFLPSANGKATKSFSSFASFASAPWTPWQPTLSWHVMAGACAQ